MTSATRKVLRKALALPEEERQQLAEMLLDSVSELAATGTEQLERAWMQEAVRRAGEVERGQGETVDGEEALSQVIQRLRGR